ncbi:MAG: hypothetical protein JNJ43_11320 [Anaerolineales bacterium]|nr:hypothetical protein [Anaerolineales bacterium]
MKSLNCPNCGASLPEKAIKASDLVACEFCGTTFRVSKTLTPEPDMGDLMLGADFSNNVMPGWEVMNKELLTFHKGNPSEMRGKYKANKKSYYVLQSSGFLDDFDASISMKFTDGNEGKIRAGFYLRFTPDGGGYAVLVSAIGSYTIGYYVKDTTTTNELLWKDLITWSNHTALKTGMNQTNRLRVICHDTKFQVYLNGVLATSFKDERFKTGRLYIAVVPSENSDLDITFSDLQLRETLDS